MTTPQRALELRLTEHDEQLVDHLKPRVPAALPDGRIPLDAMDPHLIVHAPIIDLPDEISMPGDVFSTVLDDVEITATRTAYSRMEDDYVEMKVAKEHLDALESGLHALSYRVIAKPFGGTFISGKSLINLDRDPAGGRLLPGILFDEKVVFDGLSLATLLSLPDATLIGTIPDYAEVHPRDMIHVFVRSRASGHEVSAGVVPAMTSGGPIHVKFDRATLESVDSSGVVDFYYYVVDVIGLKSPPSALTALRVEVKENPAVIPAPIVVGAADGLVTDADARPALVVQIPNLGVHAHADDSIELFIGARSFEPVRLDFDDVTDDPIKTLSIDYASICKIADDAKTTPLENTVRYFHRRNGVISRSAVATHLFDLTLPGGRDPVPTTPENEALDRPSIRGESSTEDNVITFEDSFFPATVRIGAVGDVFSRALPALEAGDEIVARLDGDAVGEKTIYDGKTYPIFVSISAEELNAHAGFPVLTYDVVRALSTQPHIVVAQSPNQLIRIDSAEALPGAGRDLAPAIFPRAREADHDGASYALIGRHFEGGFATLRLYRYANMKAGDRVLVTFTGYDLYDGGDRVPESDTTLEHVVMAEDLVAKSDPDPVTGDTIYVDMKFPIEPARRLLHGHFEYSHVITNEAGPGKSTPKSVLVRVRS